MYLLYKLRILNIRIAAAKSSQAGEITWITQRLYTATSDYRGCKNSNKVVVNRIPGDFNLISPHFQFSARLSVLHETIYCQVGNIFMPNNFQKFQFTINCKLEGKIKLKRIQGYFLLGIIKFIIIINYTTVLKQNLISYKIPLIHICVTGDI